jgi:hypothetical protein
VAILPDDLAALTRELDSIDAQARQLVSDLCETRINWQPDGGRAWSVGQCVDHLAASNRVYVAAIRTAVDRLIAECATFDPNAARFPNPFVSGLNWTIGAGLRIIAAHDRRHLWQAEQVRHRPDFPTATS